MFSCMEQSWLTATLAPNTSGVVSCFEYPVILLRVSFSVTKFYSANHFIVLPNGRKVELEAVNHNSYSTSHIFYTWL